ncbi:MAG: glycosyltransferase family 1 protein [Noviherbaspirillum sp.]|nr:glycosyltransferase family 1 protein [Noviherbaspirillum sp.]
MFYVGDSGGVHTYLNAKAQWLAKRGNCRHAIVAPSAIDGSGAAGFVGVPGVAIPCPGGYRMPWSTRIAAQKIEELQPDLVEVGDPYQFAWAALRVKRSLDIPVLAFCHSDLPQLIAHRFGAHARRFAIRYTRNLYRRFDLVLAPSRVMAQRLREMGIRQVRCQPLGVDTRTFRPEQRDAGLRERLGLPPDARLLVYAGRFTREKKLHLLLEAMQRLGAPYHLLMIGSGADLPRSERVTYLRFQHDASLLAQLIASCDVLVHPGDQETFGLVALEAMACGIPVVGVAAGGIAELVDGDTGVLVRPGSAAALAEGISGIYDADRAALGLNARRKTVERYDWNSIMVQLMGHYNALLSAQPQVRSQAEGLYAPD